MRKKELERKKAASGRLNYSDDPRGGEGRSGKKAEENKFPIEFISIKRTNPVSVLRLGKNHVFAPRGKSIRILLSVIRWGFYVNFLGLYYIIRRHLCRLLC